MKKIIEKPGKTKQELLDSLEKLKASFADKIADNKIEITKIEDGYKIRAEKRIIVKFWVDAKIIAQDGAYEISWESNAPQSKVDEAMVGIEKFLRDS